MWKKCFRSKLLVQNQSSLVGESFERFFVSQNAWCNTHVELPQLAQRQHRSDARSLSARHDLELAATHTLIQNKMSGTSVKNSSWNGKPSSHRGGFDVFSLLFSVQTYCLQVLLRFVLQTPETENWARLLGNWNRRPAKILPARPTRLRLSVNLLFRKQFSMGHCKILERRWRVWHLSRRSQLCVCKFPHRDVSFLSSSCSCIPNWHALTNPQQHFFQLGQ